MTENEISLPPTETALLKALEGEDALVVAVRGHQHLDTLLRVAISDALPIPHVIEVERLPFPLKVDLAVALDMIPADCRPGYLRINQIRNRQAHELRDQFGRDEAVEAYEVLSQHVREALGREGDLDSTPLDIFKRCIQMLFVVLQESISVARDRTAAERATMELAEETHRRVNRGRTNEEIAADEFSQRVDARIHEHVRQDRVGRVERGDL